MKIIGNIRQAIQDNGSINIAQFMSEAMYNLKEGYYIKHEPIGANGDFITSPEVSQLFGEMLGIACLDLWFKLGSPHNINLIEFGPGKGTLMEDLLRATKHVKNFHKALNIHFVDTNQRLIKLQKQRFQNYKMNFYWHNNVYDIPNDAPLIILANEFFDCLPINQYIKHKDDWYERSVALILQEFNIISTNIPQILSDSLSLEHTNSKDHSIVEICYPAIEIIKHIATIFKNQPGYMIAIDYGYDINPHTRSSYNSTLQAIKNHKYHPIFSDIGRADLTAHVDFFTLKKTALANYCNIAGTVTQGNFLKALGIEVRAQMLKNNTNILHELERLTHPKQMGNLFKVLSMFSKNLPIPIGFNL